MSHHLFSIDQFTTTKTRLNLRPLSLVQLYRMGNPHWEDDEDKQCFNPAKNFHIASTGAWYDQKHVITLEMDASSPFWSGRLVGVAEYDKIDDTDFNGDVAVVVKLETDSNKDFFVGFNRATRQNSDNALASDKVTIIEAGANGKSYSQSWFEAEVDEGESYSFGKWGKTDEELVMNVVTIDFSTEPGYAGK